MPTLRLTKEFRFEGAHALTGYDGKCRHIHGHSYILYVTVKGTPSNPDGTPKSGMLIDFTDLKRIVNDHIIDVFDHSLILRDSAPIARGSSRSPSSRRARTLSCISQTSSGPTYPPEYISTRCACTRPPPHTSSGSSPTTNNLSLKDTP